MKKLPSRPLQWAVALTGLWFIGGLYLDGWAHLHVPELETFFTPWHAVFYSGFAALALCIAGSAVAGRKGAASWRDAVPLGYGWAMLGIPFFALGGIGDMAWYEVFGIEIGIEALLSPTHLILAVSGFLMVAGNFRAWMLEPGSAQRTLWQDLPFLLSLTTLYSTLTFMTQFSHFAEVRAAGEPRNPDAIFWIEGVSIAGFMLQSAIIVGFLLFAYRRRPLPAGSVTLLLAMNSLGMGWVHDALSVVLPAGIAAGLAGDFLLWNAGGRQLHAGLARALGFFIPAAYVAVYFLVIEMTAGIWWTIHLWTGSIVIAGLAGLLTGMLATANEPKE